MLSPKPQTNLKSAQSYFTEHLAVGDYYAESNRVLGEWIGEGAEALGLASVVKQTEFVRLCENAHPRTGERLTLRLKHTRKESDEREVANRRVFFDFTFSPPKSVSVAALVGGDERIVAAHREAVKIAVRELEQFAATRIRQAGSNADRLTGNIVAALFQHETSRALDPHLHTHCIIFNATHDSKEGRWKALQNYQMLTAQKYVENVYYHELARALRTCGYTIENSARGDFRVAEISTELCEQFSKRHREIDEQTREFLGANPEKADGNVRDIREHLAHRLRSRKIQELPPERLHSLWQKQLSAEDQTFLKRPANLSEIDGKDSAAAVSWAEDHLFDRRSIVQEHELWRYALEAARGASLSLAELKRETASRDYVREPDGRLTHKDVLGREWKIVQMAAKGAGQFSALGRSSANAAESLAEDQRQAYQQILGSRDLVTLFRGGAGTGKSFVLRNIQTALEQSGRSTMVLAPQRQQVLDLTKDGLTKTKTVAEFLQSESMREGVVVIVDEAGQIGGRQMLALLEAIEAHHGRVILSGDTRQHGPVEASDALRAIERYSGLRAAELNLIRRQNPARAKAKEEREKIRLYRDTVKAAANGDIPASFVRLEESGAVIECRSSELHKRLVDAYLKLKSRNESALIVSQTRAEVGALNDSIRNRLRTTGHIAGAEHLITALDAVDVTPAQKLDGRFYPKEHVLVFNRRVAGWNRGATGRMLAATDAGIFVEGGGKVRIVRPKYADRLTICVPRTLPLSVGDRLQLKANAKAVGGEQLANGEVVEIRAVRATGKIELTDGRVLPASYRQITRGYAVTSYGSQGKTVDHVLLGDSAIRAATNAQQWYVSISRGRKSVRIFTPDKETLREHVTRAGDRPLALDMRAPKLARRVLRLGLRGIPRGRKLAKAVCLMFARKRPSLALREKQTIHEPQTILT